jgi:hypothetical protein
MKMGSLAILARAGAVAALAITISAAPAATQSTADCRCVDRDGNQVENCSCFRAPRFDAFTQIFTSQSRPRLGISVDARQSARRDASGAFVTDVLEGGPADEAGIRTGDFITSIDGQSLFEPLPGDAEARFDLDRSIPVQRLLEIASRLESGQEVEVEYVRDDERLTAVVEAEDLRDSWGRSPLAAPRSDTERLRFQLRGLTEEARERGERERNRVWRYSLERGPRSGVSVFGGPGVSGVLVDRLGQGQFGLELVRLNPALGSYFGTEEGVLVADVDESSGLGLVPGDVVVRVGDRAVTTPDRLRRILRSYADDEEISLHILREGSEMTLTGTLGGR